MIRQPNSKIEIWGASGIYWFYMIMYLFYGVIGVWLLVAGATEKNGTAPFVTGIFITTLLLPLCALLFGSFIRPLTIEQGILKIPKPFGHREVSLANLSGVGLIYSLVPRTPGWMLQIWNDYEKPIQIRRFTVTSRRNPKLAPGVKRRIGKVRDWTIPLSNENSQVLGSSKSGRVATVIYESALSLQGNSGPLVRLAKQKAVVYDPNSLTKIIAWWSPDGQMGRAKGLPGPDASKLAKPSQCDVAEAINQPSPIEVPRASPEVQSARKRNLLLTFVSFPIFIAIGIAVALVLGHQGLLSSGELCASVLGPTPVHASTACNAWRHHQLIIFAWIGSPLALGLIATIVFQVRATRDLVRKSKAASVSTDVER